MKIQYKEFILSNNSPKNLKKIYKIDNILDFLDFFPNKNYKFLKILEKFSDKITHIWEDFENNRKKIYISLYEFDFKESLKIISEIKNILWIQEKYFLEKKFFKFDCIGIDIFKNWNMELKIYEIIKNDNFYNLPDFIIKESIKETWFLKDFYGRKKKFFRFKNYENIEKFKNIFDISEVLKNPEIKWKVKYFCIEWNKKEIYFL